jgi:hypothetical protein
MNLGYRTAQRAFGAAGIAALCVSMSTGCSGTIEAQSTESNRTPRAAGPAPTPNNNTTPTGSPTAPTVQQPVTTPAGMMMQPEGSDDNPPAANPGEPPEANAGDLSFATDVWPIFNDKCGPACHVTAGFGDQNIGSEDKAEALADSVAFEAAVLMDLTAGSMPPSGCGGEPGSSPGCVTAADFDTIEAWYDQGAPP